jgi:hypothetical protein
MLVSPEDVYAGQAGFEYPATPYPLVSLLGAICVTSALLSVSANSCLDVVGQYPPNAG